MASGTVSRLTAALEMNKTSSHKPPVKMRKAGVFNNTVMTVSDRVQRQRATDTGLKSGSRNKTDLTFLERKRVLPKGSGATVATSLTLTSSGSSGSIEDHSTRPESQANDPSNSDCHSSYASIDSLGLAEFEGDDFDCSGIFADEKDDQKSFMSPVSIKRKMSIKQEDRRPNLPVEGKDRAMSRQRAEKETMTEKKNRISKNGEVKGSSNSTSSKPKEQKEKRCGRDRSEETSERSTVSSRRPISLSKKHAGSSASSKQRPDEDISERSSRRKASFLNKNDDKKTTYATSKRTPQTSSHVQKLASMIDSNHSRRIEKHVEPRSTRGSKLSSYSDNISRSSRSLRQEISDVKDTQDSRLTSKNNRSREETVRKEAEREPIRRLKHSKSSCDSSVSSSSGNRCLSRSAHGRISQATTRKDDTSHRTEGSGKRRERSMSRERRKEKSPGDKHDRQLEEDAASFAQPASLLESFSDLNYILGDGDDDELNFSSHSTQPTQPARLARQPIAPDTAQKKTSRGASEGPRSNNALPKKREEQGKHAPYRSKFRDQYGATGLVETESLAPVKAAKSIFEKNRDENDLMRISKKRTTAKNERQKHLPLELPVYQERPKSASEDDHSVSLASLVGNIVMPGSLHGSGVVSVSSKATPHSDCSDHQSERDDQYPEKPKTRVNKSMEFLEKLSLKKAKQDGCSRKFRGRVRRTKRNADDESCYETDDETVKNTDDGSVL
ncbi:hypothetical protein FisN_2Hh265 [Fistulifera solaris]|jgi:hypothetical protein|uniref:Uncharacterized protein n=1 Tax=Fistulifera solaris TaxID=1519565 RepID=A0A1Z5JEK0_FISSO|nr:hypothetical protein FisN_2Hh265 [Fistulifera solaris]|eukprot:GAX12433.1 hypothetical protein FisN_2Hh265 [Fistulifera solaris]